MHRRHVPQSFWTGWSNSSSTSVNSAPRNTYEPMGVSRLVFLPRNPRPAHGSVAFDERAVIDEHARAHVAADALADKRRELAQSVLHGVVVVAAPGVARNASTRASLRLSSAIRHTDDDKRAGLRQELARACGQVRAGDIEPRHVALVPAG